MSLNLSRARQSMLIVSGIRETATTGCVVYDFFFFFQAEDGIRDGRVTGVQTCALPIWFFNGVRVQIFPTEHLKIEPWFINGWQSYGRFNNRPGIGAQILWRPNGRWSILGNQYALGEDALAVPGRVRYHTDDSIEYKYHDNPSKFLDKAAFSLTGDMGCEHGGGVSCAGNSVHVLAGQRVIWPKQDFLGFMLYNRLWFHKDLYGFTLGGGKINNPGRYLVLLPPINGATATSGTPYFTENPGGPVQGLGRIGNLRLHAQPIHHFSLGV